MIVNVLLRSCSLLVVIAVLHQCLWSAGGSRLHRRIGSIAMALGGAIVILVTIRGMQHGGELSGMYVMHLVTGGPFFVTYFAAGWAAWKKKTWHPRMGRVSAVMLVLTLFAGVMSALK